jgi:hypothetical protein
VAWRTYTGRGYYVIDPTLEEAQKNWPDRTHQPLYTHPPQRTEQEPVARAWDEGYRFGVNDERMSEANIGIAGMGMKVEPARNNPYRTTPPQRTEQEPVAHSVVAGALFDFMGWLTSREKRLTLSSADEAGPAAESITEFAKKRGLRIEDAEVGFWTEFLSTPQPQRTKPIQNLQCFHCQDTIETLNDKVMQLMAKRTWVGLDHHDKKKFSSWLGHKSDDEIFTAIETLLKEMNT